MSMIAQVEWLIPGECSDVRSISQNSLASIRLRVWPCLLAAWSRNCLVRVGDGLGAFGGDKLFLGKVDLITDPDRGKRWLDYMGHAARDGRRTILDYTDHHCRPESPLSDFYTEAVNKADAVVCSSKKLAELLKESQGIDAVLVDDPIEVPIVEPRRAENQQKTALWFGHASNLKYLIDFLAQDYEPSERLRLIVMSNAWPFPSEYAEILGKVDIDIVAVPWSLSDMIAAAGLADMCWIPSNINDPRKSGASANRLLTALALGLPVAADPLDSYRSFDRYFTKLRSPAFADFVADPVQSFPHVFEAQGQIRESHTIERKVKEWGALLDDAC